MSGRTFFRMTSYVSTLMSLFLFFGYFIKNRANTALRTLYYSLSFYIIISYSMLIINGSKGYTQNIHGDAIYWVGGKFDTSYLFILWCAISLYYINININQKLRRYFYNVIILLLAIYGCYLSGSSTALLAMQIFSFLVLFNRVIKNYIKPAYILLIVLGITTLFLFQNNLIARIPFFNWLITDQLGEDITLTGRIHIYNNFLSIMSGHNLLGYGFESGIINEKVGLGNAQNGILDIVSSHGLIGVSVFILLLKRSLRIYYLKEKGSFNHYLLWGLMAMCICSLVEISFNFYFYLILVVMINTDKFTSNFTSKKNNQEIMI
jgi:O-Antigen ligase